jgi:hypothetical protein
MKLTRAQEQVLIGIGLATVLNGLIPVKAKKKSGAKWTKARREKFSQTMKKKWAGNK